VRGADNSFPSSAEVKKEWSYTSTPPIIRAGLRGGPIVMLYGAPAYKGS
jgi:hypothetical protein